MQTDEGAMTASSNTGPPWYLQLWFQVLVAMVIGIALGHLYPALGARMQPLGDQLDRQWGGYHCRCQMETTD